MMLTEFLKLSWIKCPGVLLEHAGIEIPALFLVLPLGSGAGMRRGSRFSLASKVEGCLNNARVREVELHLQSRIDAMLVEVEDVNVIIIPCYGVGDSASFHEFLDDCHEALKEQKPYQDLECVAYITDDESMFWDATRFPWDLEFKEMRKYMQVPERMGRVLMGFRRIGAVVDNRFDAEEVAPLLISVLVAAVVMGKKLFEIREKLDNWIKKLEGELKVEDYRDLSKDIASFSKMTGDYILLRQCKSEACTRILMRFREVSGLDSILNEVRTKLDILRDYMSSLLSLRAEESSMEVLGEIETLSRLSEKVEDVMRIVNLIAAAGIAFGLSGSVSSCLKLLPSPLNDLFWGVALFILSFLGIWGIAGILERRSTPLFKLDLSLKELMEIEAKGDYKFEEILCDLSGALRRVTWRARRGFLGRRIIISAYLDREMRIYRISCEASGLSPSNAEKMLKECASSLLNWLKESGRLGEDGSLRITMGM